MAGSAIMKDNARLYIGLLSEFKSQGATGEASTSLNKTIALAVAPTLVDPKYKVSNSTSIGELGGEAEDIDVTALDSEAKESEAGFVDNGTQDITINMVDEKAYSNLKKWQDNAADLLICQVRYSKTGKRLGANLYKGIIKTAKMTEASVGGLQQVNASIKVSGAIYDVVTAITDLDNAAVAGVSPKTINDSVFA